MLLDDCVAIVTGTGPNIGREIALTLAANGAAVVCLDLVLEHSQTCVQQIVERGGNATAVAADITNPTDVQRAIETAKSTFGGLHILVNNAAISIGGDLLQAKLEDWDLVLNVVLTGTFLCSKYAAKQMIAQESGGAIVNISSTSGHRGGKGNIAYNTAKGGILNLTRSMAIQLAPHKIRVNSVTPSTTGISLAQGGRPREEGGPPKNIPLGRWGRTIDQAQAVLFLVSSQADFITGVDLPVDGGVLAGMAPG